MPARYDYAKPALLDTPFVRAIIEENIAPVLGITETATKKSLFFASELTTSQKNKLDQIIASPPQPIRYEYGAIDLSELIESMVGVKPARVSYDEATDHATVDFEVSLTPGQEKALDSALKVARRMKRRL